MERFGEAPKKKPNALPEGALVAETQRVRNGLQIQMAFSSFRQNHPDRVVDPNSPEDRNEVMMEWIQSGAAAEFARLDIRDVLKKIGPPNLQ